MTDQKSPLEEKLPDLKGGFRFGEVYVLAQSNKPDQKTTFGTSWQLKSLSKDQDLRGV